MKIGVPKEIKAQEARVALTPGGVFDFIKKVTLFMFKPTLV